MKLFELLMEISELQHPSTGVDVFYEFEDGELHSIENARYLPDHGVILSSTVPIEVPDHDHLHKV